MQQNDPDQSRQEALRTEYSEVLNNFRMLTDIRFKLLAFLPIAAAVAAALSKGSPNRVGLAIPLFGLVATIGLATYNARNDQLYNELVGRAAAIERSLHIPDGAFANRPTAWLRITLLGRKWKIDHGTAISTIYAASIALWLFGVVAYVLDVSVENASASVNLVAIVIAIMLTYLGGRLIRGQSKSRQKEMRELARRAMNKAVGLPLPQAVSDQGFIKICARLSDSVERKVRARAKYYTITDRKWAKSHVLHGSEKLTASHLIALLTDLPPLWIFDCYTNRNGLLREDRPVNIAC